MIYTYKPTIALNSEKPSFFSLLSVRIRGMSYHTQPQLEFEYLC